MVCRQLLSPQAGICMTVKLLRKACVGRQNLSGADINPGKQKAQSVELG
jgi:hypothetical protein